MSRRPAPKSASEVLAAIRKVRLEESDRWHNALYAPTLKCTAQSPSDDDEEIFYNHEAPTMTQCELTPRPCEVEAAAVAAVSALEVTTLRELVEAQAVIIAGLRDRLDDYSNMCDNFTDELVNLDGRVWEIEKVYPGAKAIPAPTRRAKAVIHPPAKASGKAGKSPRTPKS